MGMYTKQQIQDILKQNPSMNEQQLVSDIQSAGHSVEGVITPTPPEGPRQAPGGAVGAALLGVGLGGFSTAKSLLNIESDIANKGIQKVENFANILPGNVKIPRVPKLGDKFIPNRLTTPTNAAESFGKNAEQIGEFLIPVGGEAKTAALGEKLTSKLPQIIEKAPLAARAVKGAVRMLPEAVRAASEFGAKTYAQTGSADEAKNSAALGAFSPVISKGIEKIVASTPAAAARVINSLIKPLQKDFAYGKNPGRAVSDAGIVATSLTDLGSKIQSARAAVGDAIGKEIGSTDKTLDLSSALQPLDDAIIQAEKHPNTNSAIITRLNGVKNDLLFSGPKNLSAVDPKKTIDFKGDIGGLTKWTGNPSDDKVVNGALKSVYGKVKTALTDMFPATKPLNEKYADFLSAESAIKHRQDILQRSNLVGLGPKITAAGGVISALATGNVKAALYGLGAAGVEKAMGSPAFKTATAAALAKLGTPEITAIIKEFPILKAVAPTIRRQNLP